ncbi:MAG: glycosyltransferase family 9 protein [Gilliamella sp.]|uniref:glycosyltransferase family 9 protein n=1 Tax=Gilliamella sp. TaxID=1891236 RepID=UPI0025EA9C67|nr:glycosyltransferase family 9 protein [Gilliamella sp.]MCO6538321.1 glycosyltransferase family 9 protein [Gilliamella sp.]MCO6539477.1 glycosyltransferase family 9 protein [Gilliamella sp.]
MLENFINIIRKLNRKRNYFTKEVKLLILSFKIKKTKLDLSKINKITIQACKNGLGDAIIISGLPKILKSQGYQVTILTITKNAFLFENNPNIDKVICLDKPLTKRQTQILKYLECDLFIDPNNKTSYSNWVFKVIKKIKPKHTIGFNYPKTYRIYDSIINYSDYSSHFSKRFIYILRHINIEVKEKEYKYDLYYPNKYDLQVERILSNYQNKKICIFTPYASSERRSFSEKQVQNILNLLSNYPNLITIVVGLPDKINKLCQSPNVLINSLDHFFYAVSLVKHCNFVISVDTSIVHLSNAFNKPLISIYSSEVDIFDPRYENNNVYKPNYDKAIQIIAPGDTAKNLDINILQQYINKYLTT